MKRNMFAVGLAALALFAGATVFAQDAKEGKKPQDAGKETKKHDEKKADEKKTDEKKSTLTTVEVGKEAPAFELTGADGKTYKLADFKDKVVVLEWCSKDCPFSNNKEGRLTKMLELQKKYDGKVTWLGIDSTSTHTQKDNQEYIKAEKIPYPVLLDADGKVGHAYGATNTPHIFVINKGKVVYTGAPRDMKDEGRQYLADALDAVLAGKDVPLAKTTVWGCPVKYAQKEEK